tara:strand:- start:1454 stop:1906 length:453 start_codon:yes stop_codon:yes gene_type:complete
MRFLNLFFLIIFVVSCAPTPGDKTFVPKNRKEEIQHIINVSPKWFKKIPKSNKSLFAVGTAKSVDYQTSIRKATLIAKADLADRVAGKVSDSQKFSNLENYVKEKLIIESRSERKLQNQINSVVIEGFVVSEQFTIPQGNYFRTFILLKK